MRNRTLCLLDEPEPVYSRKELKSKGWSGFYPCYFNKEKVCFKDRLMGFWNSQTGHFVTCEYDSDLLQARGQRDAQVIREAKLRKAFAKRGKKKLNFTMFE